MCKRMFFLLFCLVFILVFMLSEANAGYALNSASVQYRKWENTEVGKPDKRYRVHLTILKEKDVDVWRNLYPEEYVEIDYVLVIQYQGDDQPAIGHMAYGFTPGSGNYQGLEFEILDIRDVAHGHINKTAAGDYDKDLNSWNYGPPEYVIDGEDVPGFEVWHYNAYLALDIPKKDFEKNFQVDTVGEDVFFDIVIHMTDGSFANRNSNRWYGKKKFPVMKAENINVVQKDDGALVIKVNKPSHTFGLDQRIFSENGGTQAVVYLNLQEVLDVPIDISMYDVVTLWIRFPTHMNQCYIPARFVELMKNENSESVKVGHVLRTSDSNIRTYSELVEYTYPLQ